MILEGLHEKELFSENRPIRVAINEISDYEYPAHWHRAVELVYTQESSCRVRVGKADYDLCEQNLLMIAPGDIHSLHTSQEKGQRIFLQFDPSLLHTLDGGSLLKTALLQTRKLDTSGKSDLVREIGRHIQCILQALEENDPSYTLYLHARISDILFLLSRLLLAETQTAGFADRQGRQTGLEKLNQALLYIEANYGSELTLRDVSQAAGFSEFHFSRLFKESMEMNFHDYLNEFRVKKAERLLVETDTSVSDAAFSAGFNSLSTFHRVFRELKGCSPSAYRRMRR